MSGSFRSESSSPGRAISYSWRAIFRGCIMQGRKTAKGPKNRIEHRSHHHHQIWRGFLGVVSCLCFCRGARPHLRTRAPLSQFSVHLLFLVRFCGPFPGYFLPFSAQIPIRIPDFPIGKPGLVDPDFRPGGIPVVLDISPLDSAISISVITGLRCVRFLHVVDA